MRKKIKFLQYKILETKNFKGKVGIFKINQYNFAERKLDLYQVKKGNLRKLIKFKVFFNLFERLVTMRNSIFVLRRLIRQMFLILLLATKIGSYPNPLCTFWGESYFSKYFSQKFIAFTIRKSYGNTASKVSFRF